MVKKMETTTGDKHEHHFGELVVSHGISQVKIIMQKTIFIIMGGFVLLTGIYSFLVLENIIGGLLIIILGLTGSIPILIAPGGDREVRVYEEGFVSVRGEKVESVHFSEISGIGHKQGGVYGRQATPKIRLNGEEIMSIYVPIHGDQFNWFLQLGHAYATWRFKDAKPEELQTLDLSFGPRLRIKDSVFIFNDGRPRAAKWSVNEIQDVSISPKSLDFQIGDKGSISIRVDKIEDFHIIPYIVERFNN